MHSERRAFREVGIQRGRHSERRAFREVGIQRDGLSERRAFRETGRLSETGLSARQAEEISFEDMSNVTKDINVIQ